MESKPRSRKSQEILRAEVKPRNKVLKPQDLDPRRTKLETDIRSLQQNDMSIQEFYSAMSVLWDQLALTEPPELSSFDTYVKRRDSQRLVYELLAKKVRLKSHDDMKIVGPSVFASMYRNMTSTSTKNRPHSKGKPKTPQMQPLQQQRPSQPNNGVVAPSLDPSLIEQF
nr:Gag-Pol polyprotein [Tanacetum cinerariifolium]